MEKASTLKLAAQLLLLMKCLAIEDPFVLENMNTISWNYGSLVARVT